MQRRAMPSTLDRGRLGATGRLRLQETDGSGTGAAVHASTPDRRRPRVVDGTRLVGDRGVAFGAGGRAGREESESPASGAEPPTKPLNSAGG